MLKAEIICFDVETYRTTDPETVDRIEQAAIHKKPPRSPKEVVQAWGSEEERQKRADAALSKTAVDPVLAELLVVSWCLVFPDGTRTMDSAPAMAPERGARLDQCGQALRAFGQVVDTQCSPETWWVGHNIKHFDLAVLLNNMIRLRAPIPQHFPRCQGRHWRGRILDTMTSVPGTPNGMISLDNICKAYGLGSAKALPWNGAPMHGGRVADAFEAGAYDLITDYCEADVLVELELFERMDAGGYYTGRGREDAFAVECAAIASAQMTEEEKRLAYYSAMDRHGRLPKEIWSHA